MKKTLISLVLVFFGWSLNSWALWYSDDFSTFNTSFWSSDSADVQLLSDPDNSSNTYIHALRISHQFDTPMQGVISYRFTDIHEIGGVQIEFSNPSQCFFGYAGADHDWYGYYMQLHENNQRTYRTPGFSDRGPDYLGNYMQNVSNWQ
jgi:hypothetical protein